jgi:DNA-directed RNA polymerase specialized sigma24 family protein
MPMTTTRSLLRHAPYLRRYARALVGDQAEGDRLVQRTLEALVEGGLRIPEDVSDRVSVFRAFHLTWRGVLNGHSIDAVDAMAIADRRLQRMTPEHRTALLLMMMEGFSLEDTAFILGLSLQRTERRLRDAQAAVERQLVTDVLIIEDEPFIALDLERLALGMGHRVLGLAATHAEAMALVRKTPPGLVLADVRLADGSSGIEAATEILQAWDVPVVFITAFPERLLTGERPEPAFLVTKPFTDESLRTLIGQALFFHDPSPMMRTA